MRISASDRVRYRNSPLVEVVAQIRFERVLSLENGNPAEYQDGFAKERYPKLEIENPPSFATPIGAGSLTIEPFSAAVPRVFHFSSLDGAWKVSLCADFISLTCTAYTLWDDFKARFDEAIKAFVELYGAVRPTRVGLRYKDLIERTALGLGGTPWSQLLQPFVIGILSVSDFAEEGTVPDQALNTLLCYTNMKLDTCDLILQTAQVTAVASPERAFVIDADFFVDGGLESVSMGDIAERFETLHSSAGALFRRCITEKLHNALGPTAIPST